MMVTVQALRTERVDRALATVREAATGTGPIAVGPWLGEVGFELLYWIPFLRWALPAAAVNPARLVVVSRGGCGGWYAGLADGCAEIYDAISPDELRVLNRQRMGEQAATGPDHGLHRGQMTAKQYGVMRAEREILRRVGLDGAGLIHPSVMFQLFRLYWRQRLRDLYTRCARPVPLPKPPAICTPPYIAVKFYSSNACADRAETADQVQQIITGLAAIQPVVVLDSGDRYDDHGAFAAAGPGVTVLRTQDDPSQNLAVQTAVIAHASAFVGTYGGFAYLAPFLGVPTTALYGARTFRDDHYRVMAELARTWRVPFEVATLPVGLAQVQRGRWRHAA